MKDIIIDVLVMSAPHGSSYAIKTRSTLIPRPIRRGFLKGASVAACISTAVNDGVDSWAKALSPGDHLIFNIHHEGSPMEALRAQITQCTSEANSIRAEAHKLLHQGVDMILNFTEESDAKLRQHAEMSLSLRM